MRQEGDPASLLRFGVFELDLGAAELRKRGRRVKLEAQPFQVLTILRRRPGELVTRGDLQKELWSEDTFVEFDHSLNTAVKKIRQALGDSPKAPRYIETAPRQGYRFIAAVETAEHIHPVPDARQTPTKWILPATVALVAAIAGAVGLYIGVNNETQLEPLETVPLTSYPGIELYPAFSPDGNQFAFQWDDNIYVKSVVGENQRQITTSGGTDPSWSPDGKWIAYRRSLDLKRQEIVLLSPVDGQTRSVAEVWPVIPWLKPSLAWSPDSKWLVIADKPSAEEPHSLFLQSVDTGERRRLTSSSQTNARDCRPVFAPNGRALAFVRYGKETNIYTLALSDNLEPLGEPTKITPEPIDMWTRPLWSEDGQDVIYSWDKVLWRVAATGGGKPRRIAFTGEDFVCAAIHHGQARLICQKGRMAAGNIWEASLPAPGKTATPPKKLIDSNLRDGLPRFSPDGTMIAFVSDRSGPPEIWRCDADGSNQTKLTSLGSDMTEFPHWSPDGRRIAFFSKASGRGIYVMNADGSNCRKLIAGGGPWWSRDGASIYYNTEDPEGQIWKTPLDGGPPVQITRNGGICPLESPDGRYVYYVKSWMTSEAKPLWRIPVAGGEEEQILDSVRNSAAFDVVEDGIYFVPGTESGLEPGIYFHSFDTGEANKVVPLSDLMLVDYGLDVSPDRQSVLYSYFDWDFDLVLAEGFR